MRNLLAALCFALFAFFGMAHAQTPVLLPSGCGTGNITNGQGYITVNGTAQLCVNAAVSVNGFTPGLTFATLTATGSSASVALPGGTVVAFQNTGTTTVSCTLGVGSATALASEIQVPASSTVFMTVGANTFGACIDQTGSTSNLVVLAGGTGLGTGFGGGGGGGGGGGAITAASGSYASGALSSGSVASGAFASGSIGSGAVASGAVASGAYASGALAAGSVASGAMVDLGAQADAVCGSSTGSCSLIALTKFLNNAALAPAPCKAGTLPTTQTPVSTGVTTAVQCDLNGNLFAPPLTWNTIAASQSNQILSSTQAGGTGTTGDYLSHCVIQPTTTAAGTVTILDNATTVYTFTTGTLSNLASIPIPFGAKSTSGGWKVTTGANEIVTCFGKFT